MLAVFGRQPSQSNARIPSGIRRLPVIMAIFFLSSLALAAPAALVPPKADILSVEIQHRPMHTAAYFGAGIRPPHLASGADSEAECVSVKWFAHSPGIPPGAVVMLETISNRRPVVKNRIHRTTAKSEGNQSLLFDIPEDETIETGPITAWRVRIVWLGRVLATRSSPGWESARRSSP